MTQTIKPIDFKNDWPKLGLPAHVIEVLSAAPAIYVAECREDLLNWALNRKPGETDWRHANREDKGEVEVGFDVPGKGYVAEATVTKARNGICINFIDPKMRRRDPDAMVIGDKLPTDKPTYQERFGESFDKMRQKTLDWLKTQELIVVPFYAGPDELGYGALAIVPKGAAFFAGALADLQGMIPNSQVPSNFKLAGGAIFIAPPFRHTHFDGKQVVVHARSETHQEIFAYNLYPGPSAKKGVYSLLLDIGEREGWTTNHCAAVGVVTPYDNQTIIMHEGASGGGKSEMTEHVHRMEDGRLLLGKNVVTGEQRTLNLPEACHLNPMADDMACAHPHYNEGQTKLNIKDAEAGWFVRVDHIKGYGTDPHLERLVMHPERPLIFLNHYIVPGGQALLWEHIEDSPGKPCPNPRLIIPRDMVHDVQEGPVAVNIRSFGVRCPPTHKDSQLYGILGMLHVLSPALAWLWRLAAPRGHANPSIQDSAAGGMQCEGVGSYWAFCTGRRVDQANLLLRQIVANTETRHVLIPNQNIGAWHVGFMSEWIVREYLARRGSARFHREELVESPCSLLGYVPRQVKVEGSMIPPVLLHVQTQLEGGPEVFEHGAQMWREFFKRELTPFLTPDLDPLGRKIIQACLDDASQEDYWKLIPHQMFKG
ncbi:MULTISPECIES: DUF4914 family protein [unclassified Uliginosibacterium]|uniref:DUF4914 family protein n=1 Tax=unclassified Uliginosibacterium TaxID=2621521 RepID=UPI000C7C1277|nr:MULTISPECIES: DUF4914 family protein [unclassified Uliginosibacterium]MDO6387267.1 DUF4914 family protein [Uliginosibacterium sp. 31-12]PLK50720.1 DUF4914 domain-containing protein [Uliginosibacterium sp. TH139]